MLRNFVAGEVDIEMSLDPMLSSHGEVGNVLWEIRTQIPPETFDVSKLVCGTYADSRLMVLLVLRGVKWLGFALYKGHVP